jgi:hypothetical protein
MTRTLEVMVQNVHYSTKILLAFLYGDCGCDDKLASCNMQPFRLAYQPPASSTFLSEQTSHQQPASISQNKPAPAINHHPTEQADGSIYMHACK